MASVRKLVCPKQPKRSHHATSRCQMCWVVLVQKKQDGRSTAHHTCLFCDKCLSACKKTPTYSKTFTMGPKVYEFPDIPPAQKKEKTLFEGSFRLDTIPTKRERHVTFADQRGMPVRGLCKAPNSEVILNTSLDMRRSNDLDMPRAFQNKLKELEKTATRCGFCPRDKKRDKLMTYCIHCRKHMCHGCTQRHDAAKLYKYHATVNLIEKCNTSLL